MAILVPLVLLGLMWVVLIRPQQQRVRQQRELIASLEVGDEVVTAGGVMGRVVSLDDDEMSLEVAPGTTMRFIRMAVTSRVKEPAEDVDEIETEASGEDGEALT